MTIKDHLLRNKQTIQSSRWNDKIPVVWLELNKQDNTPLYFWTSFAWALGGWHAGFAQRARDEGFPHTEQALRNFLLAFKPILEDNPVTIFFVNCELIDNADIMRFFNALLSAHIPQLHVLILQAEAQALPVSKDTFSDSVSGLKMYWSVEEERRVYMQENIELDIEEFALVRSFTDGWKSAVSVMVNLLHQYGNTFLKDFTKNMEDWLTKVYYKQYTNEELKYIVFYSLLDGFTSDLHACLTGWNGEGLQDSLVQCPILRTSEEDSRVFCYCRFLLPKIKSQVVLMNPSDKEELYLKCAGYYEQKGEAAKAISFYQKLGNHNKVLQIAEQIQFPLTREEANCCLNVIQLLPASLIHENPVLEVIQGSMLCALLRFEEANALMRRFCERLDRQGHVSGEVRGVLAEAYAILGYTNFIDNHKIAEPETTYFLKRMSELRLERKLFTLGNDLYNHRTVIDFIRPEKGEVERYYRILQNVGPYISKGMGQDYSPTCKLAYAEMKYLQREFEAVEPYAKEAISEALNLKQYDIVCSASLLLMHYYLARNNYELLLDTQAQLRQYANEMHYETDFSMPEIADSWLELKIGDHNRIAAWLKSESIYHKTIKPWNYGREQILRCQYLLSQREYELLLAYAKTSLLILEKRRDNILKIELLVLLAIGCHKMGKKERAVMALIDVYQHVHQNRLIMPVIEYGGYIRPLIEDYERENRKDIPVDWLEYISKKAKSYYTYQTNMRRQYQEHTHVDVSVRNLTPYEIKILMLLSDGLTMKEIAELELKTQSTIKATIRRTYQKLGAKNKTEALRIAIEKGIVNI